MDGKKNYVPVLMNGAQKWFAYVREESVLHKKMKFSIKDFFSKCDQIPRKLQIWSHLLKKFLMENFIFLCSGDNGDNTWLCIWCPLR